MMKRTNRVLVIGLAVIGWGCNSVMAFEFIATRGSAMGKTLIMSEPSATTLLWLPSSGIEPGEWIVELGGVEEYGISELNRAYLAAATRFGNYTVALGLSQLGQRDFYAERTGKISLGYHWRSYGFAINLSGLGYSFGGSYSGQGAGAMGTGVTYSHPRFYLGLAADNLNSPNITESSPAVHPQFSFFGEFIGRGAYSLTGRATFEKDQSMQLALGQKIDVSRRGTVFWGFGTKPFQPGGGFDVWYNAQGTISFAVWYHPTLGFSQNLSLIYHFGRQKKPEETFE